MNNRPSAVDLLDMRTASDDGTALVCVDIDGTEHTALVRWSIVEGGLDVLESSSDVMREFCWQSRAVKTRAEYLAREQLEPRFVARDFAWAHWGPELEWWKEERV